MSKTNREMAEEIVTRMQLTHDEEFAWWHTTIPPDQITEIVDAVLWRECVGG